VSLRVVQEAEVPAALVADDGRGHTVDAVADALRERVEPKARQRRLRVDAPRTHLADAGLAGDVAEIATSDVESRAAAAAARPCAEVGPQRDHVRSTASWTGSECPASL
jgi:hypothetical protein